MNPPHFTSVLFELWLSDLQRYFSMSDPSVKYSSNTASQLDIFGYTFRDYVSPLTTASSYSAD